MAIDFDEVYNSLHNIQTKVDRMLSIVDLAKEAKVVVNDVGTFNFTTAQKTDLKNLYESLKSELVILFGALP
jgi:hypothetical protein